MGDCVHNTKCLLSFGVEMSLSFFLFYNGDHKQALHKRTTCNTWHITSVPANNSSVLQKDFSKMDTELLGKKKVTGWVRCQNRGCSFMLAGKLEC